MNEPRQSSIHLKSFPPGIETDPSLGRVCSCQKGLRHDTITLRDTSLPVHLDRVDQPVRLRKRSRILRNVSLATRSQASALVAPDTPSPVAAEGRVEDNLVALEVRIDVARAGEGSLRSAPRRRIRLAGRDISRDGVAAEEVDGDGRRGPVHGIDTAADAVEAVAVACTLCDRLAASYISVSRIAVGVVEDGADLGACIGHRAPLCGVKRHGVGSLLVDALDDVDFTR